ncbi:hypothetical protein [Streptomyces venezuelae]|nr:hypothetical protein [Streptomyces venezuelae]
MRPELLTGRCGLLWHVLAKTAPSGTLCGIRLPRDHIPAADPEAAERYCAPCMAAFRAAVQQPAEA